jgi:LysM repeat protein
MKQIMVLASLLVVWLQTAPAQDAPPPESPAAIAERQAAEEQAQRVNRRLEDLEATVQELQKRILQLQEELRKMREETTRAANNNINASFDERMKRLETSINDAEKNRKLGDEKLAAYMDSVLSQLEKGLRAPRSASKPDATPTTSGKESSKTGPPSAPSNPPENGYEYTVQSGDSLWKIVAELRKRNIKVTQKQIMDANPNVNWNRLAVRQKIFIPAPTQ